MKSLRDASLSIQRGLLGNVTPNLRAVYVNFDEGSYNLFFYYDKPLSEDEEELASLTDTEFIADFPSPYFKTSCTVEVVPYPQSFIKKDWCVYERYEFNPS